MSTGNPTDILVTGATVVTLDDELGTLEDGAVAVRDGRIAAVGASADLARDHSDLEVVDARGKAVLPGFINSHTHTVLLVLRGTVEDMAGDAIFGYMTPISFAMTPEERAAIARLGCLEGILWRHHHHGRAVPARRGLCPGHGGYRPAALLERERRRRTDAEDPAWRLRARPGVRRGVPRPHRRAHRTLPRRRGWPRALPDLRPRAGCLLAVDARTAQRAQGSLRD